MVRILHNFFFNIILFLIYVNACIPVPTQPPSNPTVNPTGSKSIVCSWDAPPYEDQNGRIIEYRVNITEVITRRVLLYVSISTSLVVESLHPDYVYEWTVTAVTIGEGPYTVTSSVRTPEDGKKDFNYN